MSVTSSISTCGAEFLTLREEHPNFRVFSIHPGIVEAEGSRSPLHSFREGQGTAHLQKLEADYLRGSFLSANWYVAGLDEHKGEIVDKKLLELPFLNTFSSSGYSWSEVWQ